MGIKDKNSIGKKRIVLININPKILIRLREKSKIPIKTILEKIKIPRNVYKKWETDGKDIPLSKLKILAKLFKRQLAVFFLNKIKQL
jgi:transcriptional regulator with XRE-family HTH domain